MGSSDAQIDVQAARSPPGSSWASLVASRPDLALPDLPADVSTATSFELPRDQREVKAKQFVAQSLQLRNDICNEPTWEAVFSDQEVNAWLAEDLVTHFADQIPPRSTSPACSSRLDRVILAFQLDRGRCSR